MDPLVPQNVTVKSEDIEIMPHSKVNSMRAELQLIPRREPTARDPDPIDERPVGAAEIFDDELAPLPNDLCMMSRHLRVRDHHIDVTPPPQQKTLVDHLDGWSHRPIWIDMPDLSDNMDAPSGAEQFIHIDSGLCGQLYSPVDGLARPT